LFPNDSIATNPALNTVIDAIELLENNGVDRSAQNAQFPGGRNRKASWQTSLFGAASPQNQSGRNKLIRMGMSFPGAASPQTKRGRA
jgi:hypothetical protein